MVSEATDPWILNSKSFKLRAFGDVRIWGLGYLNSGSFKLGVLGISGILGIFFDLRDPKLAIVWTRDLRNLTDLRDLRV